MAVPEKVTIELPSDLIESVRKTCDDRLEVSDSEIIESILRHRLDEKTYEELDAKEVRAKIQEALDDPRPSMSMEEVFNPLFERFARTDKVKRAG